MKDYAAIAEQYARDVVAGTIPACKLTKAACQRQLDDLDKFADGSQFAWNPILVDKTGNEYRPVYRVCNFLEQLPHIKGQWAGDKFQLEPWQVFVVSTVFGWIKPDGCRRFRTSYLEVPRKNGKTFLMAGIGLYGLCFDQESGAEVYAAAVKRDQAKIVWDIARRQVQKTPLLQEHFGVTAMTHSIFVEETASSFLPLSSEGNSLDGLNIHYGLIDELHAHRTREVFDVIETGTGSRDQSLIFIITTAGSNRAGICYEQREYVVKLLSGVHFDDSYFGIVYSLDDDDIANIWESPELLAKANPNYGVSVLPFDIDRLWKKAKQTPSAVNNFLTKRANVWVNADTAWMDMWRWDACRDDSLRLEDFAGEKCIIGADFASKKDMAALCLLFERNGNLYPFLRYYLPDETVRNTPNDLYSGWWREGLLTVTPGQIIDFDYIEGDCLGFSKKFQIAEFAYDPHQATQFAGRMINNGWNMVETRPTAMNFSEPMKELEARVIAGTIRHNDPILTWMVSNVVAIENYGGQIYPRKAGSSASNKGGDPLKKIDGVIALLAAMNRFMQPDETPSIYEKRGLRVV